MRIVVFDKFLGYNVGGAQQSLHHLIGTLKNVEIIRIGCVVSKSFSAQRFELPMSVERIPIYELPRFPYIEYWLNRKRIAKKIASVKGDVLITQGLWGAMAVNNFKGKTVYCVRDEYQLNRIPLYQRGLKKIIKCLYLFVQVVGIRRLFADTRQAMRRASVVVANSRYIANEVRKKYCRTAEVVYPLIAESFFSSKLFSLPAEQRFITCIGSEYMKGRPIVEALARRMREKKFLIIGREFKTTTVVGNVTYAPWTNDPKSIFARTHILLVPSICAEAFGRAAVEAMALGVPVVAANRGGISEAVLQENLVDDIWNTKLWKEKIYLCEQTYKAQSEQARIWAAQFKPEAQVQAFLKIIKSLE